MSGTRCDTYNLSRSQVTDASESSLNPHLMEHKALSMEQYCNPLGVAVNGGVQDLIMSTVSDCAVSEEQKPDFNRLEEPLAAAVPEVPANCEVVEVV